jgi:predicted transcriptional regulator
MATTTRNQLHDLVDALPESEIPAAARALAELADPFLRALAQAAAREPEELTPAEAADADTGLADVAAGRTVSDAEARQRLRGQ